MRRTAIVSGALLCLCLALAGPAAGGEVALTVVNIETPQGVKIWEPASLVARKGDTVALKLINRHADEHGYEIAAFNLKAVVGHLHPAHVVGQLLVIE
jgi:hypothetical protein